MPPGVNDCFDFCCSITHSYMTLFWSLFGLTQLTAVREGHMQPFTRRVGEYLLMAYHALAIIVLINMLIAMMSNSFQNIEVQSSQEKKYQDLYIYIYIFIYILCSLLYLFCIVMFGMSVLSTPSSHCSLVCPIISHNTFL